MLMTPSVAARGRVIADDPRCDLTTPNNSGTTPLVCAVRHNHTALVEFVLSLNNQNINAVAGTWGTALVVACDTGSLDIVRLLTSQPGIDVNLPNTHGDSPFLVACDTGRLGIVQYLLELPGVDVNQPNASNGATPLHCACGSGHLGVVDLLLKHPRVDVAAVTRVRR